MYCTRQDLNNLFGKSNIDTWADLDSDQDADKIEARINSVIDQAGAELEEEWQDTIYAIPFTKPDSEAIPETVTQAVALLSGIILWDARGLDDEDGTAKGYQAREKRVRKIIRGVKLGTRRLNAALKDGITGEAAPEQAYEDEDPTELITDVSSLLTD